MFCSAEEFCKKGKMYIYYIVGVRRPNFLAFHDDMIFHDDFIQQVSDFGSYKNG